jgi:hypothetical protein
MKLGGFGISWFWIDAFGLTQTFWLEFISRPNILAKDLELSPKP